MSKIHESIQKIGRSIREYGQVTKLFSEFALETANLLDKFSTKVQQNLDPTQVESTPIEDKNYDENNKSDENQTSNTETTQRDNNVED